MQRKNFILGAGLLMGAGITQAAVYNIYLNNTEQGPNSTATPQVHVESAPSNASTSNSGTEALGTPVATPAVTPPATIAPAPAPGTTPTLQAAVLPASSSPYEVKSRLIVGGMAYKERDDYGNAGPSLNLSYSPLSYLGFNIGGSYGMKHDYGKHFVGLAELEITPIRVNLFGYPDVLEIGALAGANTLARADDNWGSLHVGARVALNFGQRWMLNSSVRFNRGMVIGDAGLGFRF